MQNHEPPPTCTVKEAARIMGWSDRHFRYRLPGLIRKHGFPRTIPGTRMFSRARLLAWINQREQEALASVDPIAAERAALEQRAQERLAA